MKANELRIGNYVKLKGTDKPFKVFRIDTTESSTFTTAEPIPITEEKLMQLGFKYNESIKHWFINWGINGVEFIKFDEHYSLFSFQLGTGKYKVLEHIHQLQNLYFALTGEELVLTGKQQTDEQH